MGNLSLDSKSLELCDFGYVLELSQTEKEVPETTTSFCMILGNTAGT
jgi:hypothetical protein